MKILQQKLLAVLDIVYSPKPWVHGFVRQRNIVSNAKPHVGSRTLLNVDLADFFPSIHFGRVRGMFKAWPYQLPGNVATVLAQLCCYRGKLPQGAPTSPIVANMVCAKLDSQLRKLASRHRCCYTRYADDLTFSTRARELPATIVRVGSDTTAVELGDELAGIVAENDFHVNGEKLRLRRSMGRLEVTGITVNRFPNVPRRYIREIRAMLHAWKQYGIEAATTTYVDQYLTKDRGPHRGDVDFAAVVRGKIAYVRMVRGDSDPIYHKLAQFYADLDPRHRPPTQSAEPMLSLRHARQATWVVIALRSDDTDRNDWLAQGTGVVLGGVGLITCAHVVTGLSSANVVLAAFRSDRPNIRYLLNLLEYDLDRDVALLHFADGPAPFGLRTIASSGPNEVPDGGRLLFSHDHRLGQGHTVTLVGFPNYSEEREPTIRRVHVVGEREHMKFRRVVVDGGRIVTGMSGCPAVDSHGRLAGIAVTGFSTDDESGEIPRDPGVIPIDVIRQWLAEVCPEEDQNTGIT